MYTAEVPSREATRCRERAGGMQGPPLPPSPTVKRVIGRHNSPPTVKRVVGRAGASSEPLSFLNVINMGD